VKIENLDKNSFVLYAEDYESLRSLSVEDKASILDAVFLYVAKEPLLEMSPLAQLAFSFIKRKLDKNIEKWNHIKELRKEAGSIGGRKHAEKLAKQANANLAQAKGSKTKQKVANQAVTVTGTVINNNLSNDKLVGDTPTEYGNKEVNLVISTFKERKGRLPIDKSIRREAYAIVQRIHSFNKARGRDGEADFVKVLQQLFDKIETEEVWDKIQRLEPIRLRAVSYFDEALEKLRKNDTYGK
jgi:hypothetical protein